MSENTTLKTEQNTTKTTDSGISGFDYTDRQMRRAERRTHRRENGPWILGVVLILLGGFFILQNIGIVVLHNWWALFILIPALGAFSTAYSLYRRADNRLTYPVRGSFIGGVAFTLLAMVFLFDINFGILWPLILIAGGLVLLINFVLPE